jgi:hypothetical protein
MPTLTAKAIKVTVVLDPAAILTIAAPESGPPRLVLAIQTPDRTVRADLASKAIRRAQTIIREHTPDGTAVLVQGRLGA